jgi:hypothetical protein
MSWQSCSLQDQHHMLRTVSPTSALPGQARTLILVRPEPELSQSVLLYSSHSPYSSGPMEPKVKPAGKVSYFSLKQDWPALKSSGLQTQAPSQFERGHAKTAPASPRVDRGYEDAWAAKRSSTEKLKWTIGCIATEDNVWMLSLGWMLSRYYRVECA